MITRGQKLWSQKFQADIEVVRVASNREWADINVAPLNGAKPWRKRQKLTAEGEFPYPVTKLSGK